MKTIELLKFNHELLIKLKQIGIRLEDAEFVDLYTEYESLTAQGEKVSYAVAHLAEEYAISERKVYSLIKRFRSDCNPRAV